MKIKRSLLLACCTLLFLSIITGHTASNSMNIKITSPHNKAQLQGCTDITITAAVEADGKEIKSVKFYRNDRILGKDKDNKPPFEFVWKSAYDGFCKITAELTDSDNNLLLSDPIFLYVGDAIDGDLISNGEFNCKLTPWTLQVYEGAQASATIDPNYNLSGSSAILIEIGNPGTQDWNVQLYQPLPIVEGHTYEISFMADVMVDKPIVVGIQQGPAPYTSYYWKSVTLSDSLSYGPYIYLAELTDPTCKFLFGLGGNDVAVGLDAVHVLDRSFSGVTFRNLASLEPAQHLLSKNFPNPFNSTTTIQYNISEAAHVLIDLYAVTGQKLKTLVDQEQSAGIHRVQWNGTDQNDAGVPSGVYFYHIRAEMADRTLTHSYKVILVK